MPIIKNSLPTFGNCIIRASKELPIAKAMYTQFYMIMFVVFQSDIKIVYRI